MRFSGFRNGVLLSLAICLLYAAAACADVLYLAAGGGYAIDRLGLVYGTSAPISDVVTNLGASLGGKAQAFRTATGGSRVAVCQYSSIGGADTIWIYNPYNTDWKKPLAELGSGANPVSNIRAMTTNGKYLYAGGYDFAQIARFDMTGDKYKSDKTFNALNDGHWHIEELAAHGDYIYGVVTYAKDPWSGDGGYSPTKVVRFDKELNMAASADLRGKNTDGGTTGACVLDKGRLYVVSIGGSQSYSGKPNENSMVEVVDLDTLESKELISNKTLLAQFGDDEKVFGICRKSEWMYDFKSLAITPGGNVYVMMNGWGGWGPNSTVILKTTLDGLAKARTDAKNQFECIKVFNFKSYVFPHIAYDSSEGRLYACGAEEGENEYYASLYPYVESTGKWLARYDNSALGGALNGIEILLKPKVSFASKDVAAGSEAGAVAIDSISLSDNVSELSGLADYSAAVNGVDDTQIVYPGQKIVLSLDHAKISDAAPVTFTISNFEAELTAGGSFKAFVKKRGETKFDMFEAAYDKTAKTLTFTITPVGGYFSGAEIIIGELTTSTKPVPTPSGGSGGGCSAGFAAPLLLLAALAGAMDRKKRR